MSQGESRMPRTVYAVTALVLALLSSGSACASARTFVATYGSDSNTATSCGPTAPCRTFSAALSVTDSAGEMVVLNSGGYGPVTITQSVSITAPDGVYAGIAVPSSTPSGIEIATAGVNVRLKGLTLNGNTGAGNAGITMTNGASLDIEDCAVADFSNGTGIQVSGAIQVRIANTRVTGSATGISLGNGVTATLSGVRMLDDAAGLSQISSTASTTTVVNVKDSIATSTSAGTSGIGFSAQAGATGTVAWLFITNSVVSGFSIGVESNPASGNTLVSVSSSLVTGNGSGLSVNGASSILVSSGNTVTGNQFGLVNQGSGVLRTLVNNTVTDNTMQDSFGTLTTTMFK
jgi:hypothetical protein